MMERGIMVKILIIGEYQMHFLSEKYRLKLIIIDEISEIFFIGEILTKINNYW